jgi:hypothetical protein
MLMEMVEGETIEQRINRQGGISGSEIQQILSQVAEYVVEISRLRSNGLARLRIKVDTMKVGEQWEIFKSGLVPCRRHLVRI